MLINDRWSPEVERWIDKVDEWEYRISGAEATQRGSSIEADDRGTSSPHVKIAIWSGLATAVDHLASTSDLIRLDAPLRAFANFTATRAALLGASQSVWVLSGSRTLRIDRALTIEADELRQQRTFYNGLKSDEHIKANYSQEHLDSLERKVAALNEGLSELDGLRVGTMYPGRFDTSLMMREAATYMSQKTDNPGLEGVALARQWRMASGGAHARMWPVHVRNSQTPQHDKTVQAAVTTTEEVEESFHAAWKMTNFAWKLWDRRRQCHT